MGQGLSLHIGVNNTDRKSYGSTHYTRLRGCINDADAMCRIAMSRGFQKTVLLKDAYATFRNVEAEIRAAADITQPGDTFLLTFSGHGARIISGDPREKGNDEAIVLYDMIMKDDYIDVFLRLFREGSRVILVSDSCYSGTIYHVGKNPPQWDVNPPGEIPESGLATKMLYRGSVMDHMKTLRDKYLALDVSFTEQSKLLSEDVMADVVVLSACDDNEPAADGPVNGVFTECLLSVLNDNDSPAPRQPVCSYQELVKAIHNLAGNGQNPRCTQLGPHAGDRFHPFFQGPLFTFN